MATAAGSGTRRGAARLGVDTYDRLLAAGAALLLVIVLVALARGHAHWGAVPALVWAHLATIVIALALTPPMLLRRRGDARHRRLGRVWMLTMIGTAALSFGVRVTHPGHFSMVHLLSLFTLLMAPWAWWLAATHRIAAHRRAVRGLVTGALLIAGFFTLPFGRMLGRWLFG